MKRILVILLLVCYTLSAFGISMNFHYCGGHLKYVTFKDNHEKKCCKKKVMPPGCCKDNKIKFKKNGNDLLGEQLKLSFQTLLLTDVPTSFDFYLNSSIAYKVEEKPIHNNSPPDIYSPPLYLLNEVFLI